MASAYWASFAHRKTLNGWISRNWRVCKQFTAFINGSASRSKTILGVDPGIRHGVKMAVVDSLVMLPKIAMIVLRLQQCIHLPPDNKVDEAKQTIADLLKIIMCI